MDFSMAIAILVYLALPILIAVSVAYKTVRVIDLVQEIVSNWQRERVPVEVLDPEAFTRSRERCEEHFSGQGS